jgi:hypothetical protein
MSTISKTPKVNTARALNIRNANLLVSAALVVAIVVFFMSVAGSPAAKSIDHSAYKLYRKGEWLSIYLLSERKLIDPHARMTTYFNSERTRIPMRLTKYQRSECFRK